MSLPAWTVDQVAAMAPDPGSAKAGHALATPRKWVSTGRDARALWGECQGSGSKPYQVIVDAAEPAFRCSCPSRKFPCKHGLGLLLLYAAQPAQVPEAEPPAWVAEWLTMREARAEKKAEKAAAPAAAERIPDPAAQAKRAAQREERVRAGLDDLEQWLHDGVRQGLAAARGRPHAEWERVAARLVDAQAQGAARLVREMTTVPDSGNGWPDRLLERMARLQLLAGAARRMDALPEEVAADVRTALGWTARQEEVLAGPGERDTWIVLGARTETEDKLRVQRTWLRGESTGRTALLLAFAAGGQPLEPGPPPGTRFAAELAFYPGAHPLRAVIRERTGTPEPVASLPGADSLEAALGEWSAALSRNPWTERLALPLRGVTPARDGERWMLADSTGAALPLAPSADGAAWILLAAGGGRPIEVAAEWDGVSLLPLAAVAEGRFLILPTADGGGA
ncbi:MAG TPA: SWIM zinc finger family protein [Longimicrobium sp.]|nr:SWIM zinc finger family protein [Longimicrobium sp.]